MTPLTDQPDHRPGFKARQAGNIVPVILISFVLIMLTAGTLIHVFANNEEAAIDRSLAQIQSYWALQGSLDYSLSRMGFVSIPNTVGGPNVEDDDRMATLTGYAATSTASSFAYFGAGANPDYRFNVGMNAVNSSALDDGLFTATLSLAAVGTTLVPLLQGVSSTQSPLRIDLCVGNQALNTRFNNADCTPAANDGVGRISIDAYRRR